MNQFAGYSDPDLFARLERALALTQKAAAPPPPRHDFDYTDVWMHALLRDVVADSDETNQSLIEEALNRSDRDPRFYEMACALSDRMDALVMQAQLEPEPSGEDARLVFALTG